MMVQAVPGIPMPEARGPINARTRYPWATMEVRESFPIDGSTPYSQVKQANANPRYYPRRFSCRKMRDGSGFRVWRVE